MGVSVLVAVGAGFTVGVAIAVGVDAGIGVGVGVGASAGVVVGDGPMIGLSGTTWETPGLAVSAVASDCGTVAANASTR